MSDTADFQVIEIEGLPWNETNIQWCRQHLECTGCGRCCREMSGGVKITYDEAKTLAEHLAVSNKEFYKVIEKHPGHCIIAQPCRFLRDNRCTVQAVKPNVCLSFPLYYRQASPWITIAACPAGQKLIDTLLNGRGQPAAD